ncbi:hypothetical protein HFD88_001785 [Aspergillus terreus]|nr:hypothetical protein HFD88_001785 [Aspergillus terreus]
MAQVRAQHNEEAELSKRYVKFNLQKLLETAVYVTHAQHCTKVLKCREGLHNKAFVLTMDNGTEVVAKLPNPNAGPAHYTTASEVATQTLLREVLGLPVPRVMTWSSDAATHPVEAEFIIEEKATGVRLGSVWNQWPWELKLRLITQIVDIERQLASMTFPFHGCIYFKVDLRSWTGTPAVDTPASLHRFAIGPLTSMDLWAGPRPDMELDRGPWRTPCAYTRALGHNEKNWIQTGATPRINHYRSSHDHERPTDALHLLDQYFAVAPYLIPAQTDEAAASNVLWHPDLHRDNVFVDPLTGQITSIIDWQAACVAPLFYQSDVPRMFRHTGPMRQGWAIPERPDTFDSLSAEGKEKIDADLESETIHKYYQAQVCKRAPRHWAVLQQPLIPLIRKPVELVSGAWKHRRLFFLRQSLMWIARSWGEIVPGDVLCPIAFTTEELELHSWEEENMDGVGRMLALFRHQGVLPVDGMVELQDYAVASDKNRKFRKVFIESAGDEAEKRLFENLWPYQEQRD